VDAHDVPKGEVSRSANTLLAFGAEATLATDVEPRLNPAKPTVSAADAEVPLCWTLPLPHGSPVFSGVPTVSLQVGDDDDEAAVVLTVHPESPELVLRVMPFPLPPGSNADIDDVEPCVVGHDGCVEVGVAGSLSTCEAAETAPTGVCAVPPTLSAVPPVVREPWTFDVCSICIAESASGICSCAWSRLTPWMAFPFAPAIPEIVMAPLPVPDWA
jgi:hypothetical protein